MVLNAEQSFGHRFVLQTVEGVRAGELTAENYFMSGTVFTLVSSIQFIVTIIFTVDETGNLNPARSLQAYPRG